MTDRRSGHTRVFAQLQPLGQRDAYRRSPVRSFVLDWRLSLVINNLDDGNASTFTRAQVLVFNLAGAHCRPFCPRVVGLLQLPLDGGAPWFPARY